MKTIFTIARGALLPALSAANKTVEKRTTIPILANVMLAFENGSLTVTGTDLDVEIRASIEADGLKAFEPFTLPSSLLHDAVKKMPAGAEVTFSLGDSKDDHFITVSAGRTRFRLQTLPAGDFPNMQSGDLPHNFSMPANLLGKAFGYVSFALATDETRYYLNGIHLHHDDDGLVFVATDGHRLARHKLSKPEGMETIPAIIIPRRTIQLLNAHTDNEDDVQIALSENKIRFTFTDGSILTSKLIDGTFPEYKRVIPVNNGSRFKLDSEPMSKALDRVLSLSSDKSSGCKFQFDDSHLSLTVNNPDQGTAEDQVPTEHITGDDVSIGFNGKYCLDMLNAADCKQLFFDLADAGSPALIFPSVDGQPSETTCFVLMPMRI